MTPRNPTTMCRVATDVCRTSRIARPAVLCAPFVLFFTRLINDAIIRSDRRMRNARGRRRYAAAGSTGRAPLWYVQLPDPHNTSVIASLPVGTSGRTASRESHGGCPSPCPAMQLHTHANGFVPRVTNPGPSADLTRISRWRRLKSDARMAGRRGGRCAGRGTQGRHACVRG
ncbi:hypothetical protein OH76DRAFT_61255 [Lentinus brumalis]|uniref:Uncharacterized protein n=1 Tax=Lentinus brumalis TaxID=2498619 RepID=A0A371DKE8_9APHY|nr:hypothetical protein OH76DRAFT_61255 [Polyporus brumalis]